MPNGTLSSLEDREVILNTTLTGLGDKGRKYLVLHCHCRRQNGSVVRRVSDDNRMAVLLVVASIED